MYVFNILLPRYSPSVNQLFQKFNYEKVLLRNVRLCNNIMNECIQLLWMHQRHLKCSNTCETRYQSTVVYHKNFKSQKKPPPYKSSEKYCFRRHISSRQNFHIPFNLYLNLLLRIKFLSDFVVFYKIKYSFYNEKFLEFLC